MYRPSPMFENRLSESLVNKNCHCRPHRGSCRSCTLRSLRSCLWRSEGRVERHEHHFFIFFPRHQFGAKQALTSAFESHASCVPNFESCTAGAAGVSSAGGWLCKSGAKGWVGRRSSWHFPGYCHRDYNTFGDR